jgi:hypothetical protein
MTAQDRSRGDIHHDSKLLWDYIARAHSTQMEV